ncbi:MAG: cation diffusion facilitator family transporter [Armatimonadota bacterium]|nr:cation diffusion facilitator family transporter [Armatimonadota bacterium]
MTTKADAARLSVLSNTILVAIKLAAGLLSGSVAIVSEAAHSAIDLMAAAMAYFSVRVAEAPADHEHPYGHGKIENLSGAIEATLIFGAAAYIVYEAVHKLLHPEPVRSLVLGISVMMLSATVNILVSRWLFHIARETDSVALEADAQHLSVDVYTSFGVMIGLGLIQLTGAHRLDPIIGLFVALVITKVAYDLVKRAGAPLIDTGLPEQELDRLSGILCGDPRIVAYHKLRTRKAGAERHIDVHLLVDSDLSVAEGHRVAEETEDRIRAAFERAHVITHVEPVTEEEIGETGVVCRRQSEES